MLYRIRRSCRKRKSFPEVFRRPTFSHKTPLVVASKYGIQAPTLTAGREREEEISSSPGNENTNEEEENSTIETNNKYPEDELDT